MTAQRRPGEAAVRGERWARPPSVARVADRLAWPREWARDHSDRPVWFHPGSNLCLDFHGDPRTAGAVLFSDGNHHMALGEALAHFCTLHPAVGDVFYATTPPGVVLQALERGGLSLGNLFIGVRPDVFVSPAPILDRLVANGTMARHAAFARSRGNVLLVRAGNPCRIRDVRDLARSDVRLFLSNPRTEAASYQVYRETLTRFARRFAIDLGAVLQTDDAARVVYGECIHHREAPQALADGRADVAVLYYHLALRYTRVFPGVFEVVALDGSGDTAPDPSPDNVTTAYHAGLVGNGGAWGRSLLDFLMSETVAAIYERHGLRRVAA